MLILDVQKDDVHIEIVAWTSKVQPFAAPVYDNGEESEDDLVTTKQVEEEKIIERIELDCTQSAQRIRKPPTLTVGKITKLESRAIWTILRLLSYLPWEPNNYFPVALHKLLRQIAAGGTMHDKQAKKDFQLCAPFLLGTTPAKAKQYPGDEIVEVCM